MLLGRNNWYFFDFPHWTEKSQLIGHYRLLTNNILIITGGEQNNAECSFGNPSFMASETKSSSHRSGKTGGQASAVETTNKKGVTGASGASSGKAGGLNNATVASPAPPVATSGGGGGGKSSKTGNNNNNNNTSSTDAVAPVVAPPASANVAPATVASAASKWTLVKMCCWFWLFATKCWLWKPLGWRCWLDSEALKKVTWRRQPRWIFVGPRLRN